MRGLGEVGGRSSFFWIGYRYLVWSCKRHALYESIRVPISPTILR